MKLRPYQLDLKRSIYDAWSAGAQNVLAVLPTGGGKTIIFSDIIREHNGPACAIAHRKELVCQISLALARAEIRHRIIGQENVVRLVNKIHTEELGKSYYHPNAHTAVASVDTLVRWAKKPAVQRWGQSVTLWVQDECKHLLKDNKWGKAVQLFPNARGLGVDATPCRLDGKGLGTHVDGIFDVMVSGPTQRQLINAGYLTDYIIYAPPSDLDMSSVKVSADGDYSKPETKKAVRRSHIIGDVVAHYLRIAPGKLGVTFATDVETATDIAAQFNAAGVPAAVVSANTPDAERVETIRRFRRRELLQLVNVDLFGEGFDLPAIEVVSMARPTQSFALFCLDPETEILTPTGWKRYDGVENEVIAFDHINDRVQTVPVTGYVKRNIYPDEQMYTMKGPHLDFMVSDKHDLLVRGLSMTNKNWQKQHAEHVAKRNAMMRVPVAGEGNFPGAGLSDSELHLLGWYLSDGSVNRKTNSLVICQSVAKQKHVDSIRESIKGCGFKYAEKILYRKSVPETHHDLVRFHISKGIPRGTDKHLTGWGRLSEWVNKDIPECYDRLSRDELKKLLETLNLGDGVNCRKNLDYEQHTMVITCGTNQRMADRIQALCVTRGLRCNLSTVQYGERSKWFILNIRDIKTASMPGTNNKDGQVSSHKKPYKRSRLKISDERPDFVWCVSNPLGTLITRRNGKVIIMGNCQQAGRALRPLQGKPYAYIIDHVGNVARHARVVPENGRLIIDLNNRIFTLDRQDRRSRQTPDDVIPTRTCMSFSGFLKRFTGNARIVVTSPYPPPVPVLNGSMGICSSLTRKRLPDCMAVSLGSTPQLSNICRIPAPDTSGRLFSVRLQHGTGNTRKHRQNYGNQ